MLSKIGREKVNNLLVFNIVFSLVFSFVYFIIAKIEPENGFNGLDDNSNIIDFIYFSTTTMSSVGYGDISPKSLLAKCVVIMQQFFILINIIEFIK